MDVPDKCMEIGFGWAARGPKLFKVQRSYYLYLQPIRHGECNDRGLGSKLYLRLT